MEVLKEFGHYPDLADDSETVDVLQKKLRFVSDDLDYANKNFKKTNEKIAILRAENAKFKESAERTEIKESRVNDLNALAWKLAEAMISEKLYDVDIEVEDLRLLRGLQEKR